MSRQLRLYEAVGTTVLASPSASALSQTLTATDATRAGGGARVATDAQLNEIDVDLIQWLQKLEPFGRSNPEPLLRLEATLDQVDPIGRTGSHVAIRLRSGSTSLRAIWFNAGEFLPRLARGRRVLVLGVPRENRFRGSVSAEVEVKDLALMAESETC